MSGPRGTTRSTSSYNGFINMYEPSAYCSCEKRGGFEVDKKEKEIRCTQCGKLIDVVLALLARS